MNRVPRLAFVGVGWIGRHRMEAALKSGTGEAVALADVSSEALDAARALAPGARTFTSIQELLAADLDLDAVVIATPSAQHASESELALARGLHVFCQKPLGRNAAEVERVVSLARAKNKALGVDLSYRSTEALQRLRPIVRAGEIGHVYAVRLVFHNAYGPDKPWFYDRSLAGGGCVIDLGVHLVDAALYMLDFPKVRHVSSRLFAKGRPLPETPVEVEDYAIATLDLEGDCVVELACSWNLPAGQDAVISAEFYGSNGGVAMRNVNGSFYDFVAERFVRTARETLCSPPDAWGGRALVEWLQLLRERPHYHDTSEQLVEVARVVDAIYGRGHEVRERRRASEAALSAS